MSTQEEQNRRVERGNMMQTKEKDNRPRVGGRGAAGLCRRMIGANYSYIIAQAALKVKKGVER